MATVTTIRHPVALSHLQQGKEQGGGIAGAALTLIFRVRDTSWCERAFLQAFTLPAWLISYTLDGLLLRVPFTKVGVWFVSLNSGGVVSRIPHLTLVGDCPPAGPPCPSHLNGKPTVGL